MMSVQRIINGQLQAASTDALAVETAIAIEINGLSHAVMMGTPDDLHDFAVGFTYSEGIIQSHADVYDIEFETVAHGINLRMTIAASCFAKLKQTRRTLLGRTGCGICGVESLAYFQNTKPPANTRPAQLDVRILDQVLHDFERQQPLREQTGATHAAAWVNWQGQIIALREDVGRHNALDKLIGALLRSKTQPADGFVLVSSRASFEMVQKTAHWGANCLVAVSAATTQAVQWAHAQNLQLIGFARIGKAVQYTDIKNG